MNILDAVLDFGGVTSGYRRLESESDELILRLTEVDPKRMPRIWRRNAREIVRDLVKLRSTGMNEVSAAIIKLAFYCNGFERIADIPARSRIAKAIKVLRNSREGAGISTEASEFSYSFAGE